MMMSHIDVDQSMDVESESKMGEERDLYLFMEEGCKMEDEERVGICEVWQRRRECVYGECLTMYQMYRRLWESMEDDALTTMLLGRWMEVVGMDVDRWREYLRSGGLWRSIGEIVSSECHEEWDGNQAWVKEEVMSCVEGYRVYGLGRNGSAWTASYLEESHEVVLPDGSKMSGELSSVEHKGYERVSGKCVCVCIGGVWSLYAVYRHTEEDVVDHAVPWMYLYLRPWGYLYADEKSDTLQIRDMSGKVLVAYGSAWCMDGEGMRECLSRMKQLGYTWVMTMRDMLLLRRWMTEEMLGELQTVIASPSRWSPVNQYFCHEWGRGWPRVEMGDEPDGAPIQRWLFSQSKINAQ